MQLSYEKYKSIGSHIATEQSCSAGLPLCVSMVFNMEEIWKDIPGLEGMYQVSTFGRIRSLDRIYHGLNPTKMKGRILNGYKGVYRQVNIQINGIRFRQNLVHRLVAKTFIPNPENKPYVNHIDGKKFNNIIENLEWCTPKENDFHAMNNGLKATGERNGSHKLTQILVDEIRGKYIPHKYTNKMLAKEYNMSYHEIQLINQEKRWKQLLI